jgi:hypothetical protein
MPKALTPQTHEQKQNAIQGVTVKVLEQQKKGSDAVAVTDAGNLE